MEEKKCSQSPCKCYFVCSPETYPELRGFFIFLLERGPGFRSIIVNTLQYAENVAVVVSIGIYAGGRMEEMGK